MPIAVDDVALLLEGDVGVCVLVMMSSVGPPNTGAEEIVVGKLVCDGSIVIKSIRSIDQMILTMNRRKNQTTEQQCGSGSGSTERQRREYNRTRRVRDQQRMRCDAMHHATPRHGARQLFLVAVHSNHQTTLVVGSNCSHRRVRPEHAVTGSQPPQPSKSVRVRVLHRSLKQQMLPIDESINQSINLSINQSSRSCWKTGEQVSTARR